MTRKSPVRHQVDSYTRSNGKRVSSYYRGSEFPTRRRSKVVKPDEFRMKVTVHDREYWMTTDELVEEFGAEGAEEILLEEKHKAIEAGDESREEEILEALDKVRYVYISGKE